MKKVSPFVITISRQLGSGGAYVGQQLAKNLGILYFDREIICQAAKQLSVLEEDIESRDEKTSSIWESFMRSCTFCDPYNYNYIPPQIYMPTDAALYKAETEVIESIAKERSAVIIGRCGSHILRDHPNHVSIFLHADINFRKVRVQELYNLSAGAVEKTIKDSDFERRRYHYKLTGKEWEDARQYDISIDTGKVDLDKSVELILKYLELI